MHWTSLDCYANANQLIMFSSDLKYIILHYLRVRQCYGSGYSCMQSVDTNIFIFILHLLSKQEPLAMFGQKIVTAFQHKNVANKQDPSALFISEHVVYNQSRITLTSLIHSWTLRGQSDNSSLCTMIWHMLRQASTSSVIDKYMYPYFFTLQDAWLKTHTRIFTASRHAHLLITQWTPLNSSPSAPTQGWL